MPRGDQGYISGYSFFGFNRCQQAHFLADFLLIMYLISKENVDFMNLDYFNLSTHGFKDLTEPLNLQGQIMQPALCSL